MEELLFVDEVAREMRVTRKTVYDWMRAKGLEYKFVGGRRRISRSALQAFINLGETEVEEDEVVTQKNATPGTFALAI